MDHAKIVDKLPEWKIVNAEEALERRQDAVGSAPITGAVALSVDGLKKEESSYVGGCCWRSPYGTRATRYILTVESASGERKIIGIRNGRLAWRHG